MTRGLKGPRRPIDLSKFQFEHPGYYTLHDCFCDYSHQKLIRKGKDCLRPWIGFNNFMEVVPPSIDVTKLKTGQVEEFIDVRTNAGVSLGTVRRELVFVKAAIKHAHRRNRILLLPSIELPDYVMRKRRPLTEAEFRLVISKPMSERLRRFYWLAYFTGHRSMAIEELTWSRVNLGGDEPTIDFNVPGRAVTNKRRCADFPIPDALMPRLLAWQMLPHEMPEAEQVPFDIAA